jgi:hypothetical protein
MTGRREKEEGPGYPSLPLRYKTNDLKPPTRPHFLKFPSLSNSNKLKVKSLNISLGGTSQI